MEQLERLEEIAKFCKQMVSIISHDLRSPLSSIIMSIRRLQQEDARLRSEDALVTLSQIERSINGMLEMIDYILDIEKLSSGTIELYYQQFDISLLIDEIIEKIAAVSTLKGISLHNTVNVGTRVYGDRMLLGRVMHNLLSNALKFCSRGNSVIVSSGSEGEIIVRDDGPGISKELQGKLFKAKPSAQRGTSGESGFGLGLPSAYKIIEAHGGNLSANSMIGEGSTFTIELPPFHPRVVIVSPDQEFESRMTALMEKIHSTRTKPSSYKSIADSSLALDQLHKGPPDNLIIDISGAENEGIALCHKLRNHFLGNEVIIVLCLPHPNPDDDINWLKKEAITAGADAFFATVPDQQKLAKVFHQH